MSTRHHQLCLTIIVSRVNRSTIVDKNTNLKSFTEERIPDPLSLLLNVSKSIQLRIFEAAQMFRAIGLLLMCLLLLTSHTSLVVYTCCAIYDWSNDIFACFSPLLVFVLHEPNKQVSFFPTTTTIKQKRTCENEWLNSQFCSMKQLEMERVSVALRMKLHVSISIS